MSHYERIDAVLRDCALVFGSIPPGGRDLDLLVREREGSEVAKLLRDSGWLNSRRQWVNFHDCTVDSVDLIPAADWLLPDSETQALFTEAMPIEGFAKLVRPASHHALLILARRIAGGDGRLDEKRRARIDEAIAADPAGWERALQRAPMWGATRALAELRRAHASGRPIPAIGRAIAARERIAAAGGDATRAGIAAARVFTPGRRGGFVVAMSGLDGAGKSTQAEALAATLDRLGHVVDVEWSRLAHNPSLDTIARPVKKILRRSRGSNTRTVAGETAAGTAEDIRERSALVTHVWATIVALMNGWTHRRQTRKHLARGGVVICDRYVLDSAAHMRRKYGTARRFPLQVGLLRALSARPLRAYLLDVPAAVAYSRKADMYGEEQLALQASLYREEADRLGVTVLDGMRPVEELCAEIGKDVWSATR